MSEYQYYEFRAIDRPLTKEQMSELRAISSRADITPTSFTNVYNWGDLRGDPRRMMEQYFDAMVYVANWGTHQLMFRIPSTYVDVDVAQQYLHGDYTGAWTHGAYTLIDIAAHEEEGGYWEEGEGYLSSLISLRADLIRGDLRCLYLGWLRSLQQEYDLDEAAVEPPVPPGLSQLSAPLEALVDYLWLDRDVFDAAAENSPSRQPPPSHKAFHAWLTSLPQEEKDAYLLRFVEGRDLSVTTELEHRFRQTRGDEAAASSGTKRRTVGELWEIAEQARQQRKKREAQRQAAEQARRVAEERARREERIAQLAQDEVGAWASIEQHIEEKKADSYDAAVHVLKDLKEVYVRSGREHEFKQAIEILRDTHGRKYTLMERLKKAGL